MAIITPNVALKEALANAWLATLATGSSDPTIALYAGSKPENPGVAVTNQVLLGTGTCDPAVGTVETAGYGVSLIFGPIAQDAAADANGIATWARFSDGDGTPVFDVDVSSTSGSGFFKMNTTNVVAGGPIAFTSCVLSF
jgi:hypothetical protein